MVFEIVGFEAEFESLAALPTDHMTDDHAIPVTFEGVFPASFMRLYTPAETFAEFMVASPWNVTSLEDFEAIPDDNLDRDVAGVSRDLDLLFEADIIEFEIDGQRKIPRLKHEIVVAEPIA